MAQRTIMPSEQTEMSTETIRVVDVAGTPYCMGPPEGQRVHEAIAASLARGAKVRLSFEGVDSLAPLFLHLACGQFVKEHSPEWVEDQVTPIEVAEHRRGMLHGVLLQAVDYYASPERFRRVEREILETDDF